jgi:hypothetical protein
LGSSRRRIGRCTNWRARHVNPHPPPCAPPSPTGMRRRRTPIAEGGNRAHTRTRTVTDTRAALRSSSSCTVAPAGRRVEHMTHELLLPSADPCALVFVLLCHAQRWGTGVRRMHTHTSSPFRPLTQPTVGLGVAGRTPPSGEGRGASPRRARRSTRWCKCLYLCHLDMGQVLIACMHALATFRSNLA